MDDDDAGAGEPPLFQDSLLHPLEDQLLPPAASASGPPPSSPAAASASASASASGGAGLGRRLLSSMSLSRTLSAIGLTPPLPQNPPASGLGLGLVLHLNHPCELQPTPTVDHVIDRSPSSLSSFSDAVSGFGEQDDDQAPEKSVLDTIVLCDQPHPHLIQQGQQMLVDQNIGTQLKLTDDDLPVSPNSMLQVEAWEKPVISQGAADDQLPTNRIVAVLEYQGHMVEQRHELEAAMDGNVSQDHGTVDQYGTIDNQGAIKNGNTVECQEEVLVNQGVIEERGEITQDIAVGDQNKAVEQFDSAEFRGTMDNYAMGYLEVVEHDVIGESGETTDGIAVDDQVKEMEHDVIGDEITDGIAVDNQVNEMGHDVIPKRSETTDGITVKDQEQVMEQFASNEPGATNDNNAVEEQELVGQSVIDEWCEITDNIAVEDQRKALQQCIGVTLGATKDNNAVEDPTMMEQGIADEIGEAMDDIAVEDQEMTEQCTDDELEGTENDNALEDRVSEQGAIDERGTDTDAVSTENQEIVEQCAGDVSSITKDKDAVEKKVEQYVIGKEDIAMTALEKAMEQCVNDELRTNKNEKAVEEQKRVEEQVVIDENVDHVCHKWGMTEDDLAIDVAASVGTNCISSSEDSITLNDTVNDWGAVNEKVKVFVAYPQRPGKLNCPFYLSTGSCSYGLSCNFNHPPLKAKLDVSSLPSEQENHGATEILELNRVGLPIREGARSCSYYMRNGTCSYGKKCHFNHPEQVISAQFDPPTGWEDDALPSPPLSKKSHDNANPDETSYSKRSSTSEVLPPNILRMLLPPQKVPSCTEEKAMKINKDVNWSASSNDSNGCRSAVSSGGALNKQEHVNYPERPRRPECPFYTRFGDCKFASACKYHHSRDRFPNKSSAAPDNSNECHSADSSGGALCKQEHVDYPERPGRPECPFYTRFGDCKFASACKYHHSKDRFPSRCQSNDPLQGEELVEYPERPGEPECPFYMKNGCCKFGVECKFHHSKGSIPSRWSPKDVKKPVAPKEHHPAIKIKLQDHMCQQDQHPERPGQPDCRYYMQFGKCKYWSACIFHHPKDRLSNGWHPSDNVLKQEEHTAQALYPERPGELECVYYMRHGSCKFQRNCKYHHPKDRLSHKSYDPAFD